MGTFSPARRIGRGLHRSNTQLGVGPQQESRRLECHRSDHVERHQETRTMDECLGRPKHPGAQVAAVSVGQSLRAVHRRSSRRDLHHGRRPPRIWAMGERLSEGQSTPARAVTAVPWGQRFRSIHRRPGWRDLHRRRRSTGRIWTMGECVGGSEHARRAGHAVPWGNRFALFIADAAGAGIYTTGGDPQGGFGPMGGVSEGQSHTRRAGHCSPRGDSDSLYSSPTRAGGSTPVARRPPRRVRDRGRVSRKVEACPGHHGPPSSGRNGFAVFLADPNGGVYAAAGRSPGRFRAVGECVRGFEHAGCSSSQRWLLLQTASRCFWLIPAAISI
jgi:hypothetical protein